MTEFGSNQAKLLESNLDLWSRSALRRASKVWQNCTKVNSKISLDLEKISKTSSELKSCSPSKKSTISSIPYQTSILLLVLLQPWKAKLSSSKRESQQPAGKDKEKSARSKTDSNHKKSRTRRKRGSKTNELLVKEEKNRAGKNWTRRSSTEAWQNSKPKRQQRPRKTTSTLPTWNTTKVPNSSERWITINLRSQTQTSPNSRCDSWF